MVEFKPGGTPEEKSFYETEWQKISEELGKDENLVNKYEEFLRDEFKERKVAERFEMPAEEKISPEKKLGKQEPDEWSLENLNKINKSDKNKLFDVFFGFVILKKIIMTGLINDDKDEEAKILDVKIQELAKQFSGKGGDSLNNLLIEWRNIFFKYGVSDAVLNIDNLSAMARDFKRGVEREQGEEFEND